MRILLAEDDPDVRGSMHDLLEALGHNVVAVEDGETALGLLSAEHDIDIVVSDTSMRRDGITGAKLLEEVRKSGSKPSFVLMSGQPALDGLSLAIFARENGAVFIQKGALKLADIERAISDAVAISAP